MTRNLDTTTGPVALPHPVSPARWLGRACAIALLPALLHAHAFDPNEVAGVYKDRFTNSLVSGETFDVEDVLEIVPLTPETAYVKARFHFYNGHECAFAVVADVEGDALVYRSAPGDPAYPGQRCVLKVKVGANALTFDDQDLVCRQATCGMRGGYQGRVIDRTARRPIRYLDLLKGSADFRQAVAEHQAH